MLGSLFGAHPCVLLPHNLEPRRFDQLRCLPRIQQEPTARPSMALQVAHGRMDPRQAPTHTERLPRLGGIGREFGVARKYLTRHADLDPCLRTLLEARPSPPADASQVYVVHLIGRGRGTPPRGARRGIEGVSGLKLRGRPRLSAARRPPLARVGPYSRLHDSNPATSPVVVLNRLESRGLSWLREYSGIQAATWRRGGG